jgi:hypothetical protein
MELQLNDVGFKELDKTSEYMETHYYKLASAGNHVDFYNMNRFIMDYLLYILDEKFDQPFLTDSFIDIPKRFAIFAVSTIDFRFESQEVEGESYVHKFKSDKKRGIFVSASENAIVFVKEIKESDCDLKNDILITHRYQQWTQAEGFRDSEINEMVMNTPYQCEIIMTNISSKFRPVNLLFQIPNGSLPLMVSKTVDSKQFDLHPYTTLKQTVQFYFPADGKFDHAPSNITENNKITAKSAVNTLEVGKKRVISKIETFVDLMMTTRGDHAKKEKILELL